MKRIPQSLLDKLRPSSAESELPHLYYNPEDHKLGEPLRPIVSGIKSPLVKIASFLDKINRPLFNKHTPLVLLKHLKEYKTTSETNLYTFDITDLYTMIPQKEAVLAVCEFLGRNGCRKIGNLSINTIKSLFLHVLENSYFVLQQPAEQPKYYKQIRGGVMGSACTQVLADIYVKKWENILVKEQHRQKELYFRFRDDVFLTRKQPLEKMNNIFEELNKSDPNLKIQWEGGKSVDYLDVTIRIEIPNFRTRIYCKLAAQPYVLPYHSVHPKHIMRNIPYGAALRAARICSHPNDLREELDRIKITLMLNKYSATFVDEQMQRFYKDLTRTESIDRLIGENHATYRNEILNEQWNKKEKRGIDFRNDITCHFSCTPTLARFGTTFHKIWKEIFQETPLDSTRIIYANRLTSNLKQLLVKKRPNKNILKLQLQ
ncbi:unnamed protein product [Rotaria sp. Silwood2]|nr:unnamed protein product [Rotaria sp. Silwood2]